MSTTITEQPSIKRLCREHVWNLGETWRNLHFEDSGKSRLAHCAGFIMALNSNGQEELASSLADDLCRSLDYLNGYGGPLKIELSDGEVTVPAYRIVLSDDGSFGGFGVLWYSAVLPEKWSEMRQALPMFDDNEPYSTYEERVGQANRIRKDLTESRAYWPTWQDKGEAGARMSWEFIRYRYSFNGGLLFHGFGYNSDTITLSKRYWSLHT